MFIVRLSNFNNPAPNFHTAAHVTTKRYYNALYVVHY